LTGDISFYLVEVGVEELFPRPKPITCPRRLSLAVLYLIDYNHIIVVGWLGYFLATAVNKR
jgi:hypothetical protein